MAKHKSIASDFEVLVGDRARRANRGGDEATTRGVSDDGFVDPIALSTTTNASWRCARR